MKIRKKTKFNSWDYFCNSRRGKKQKMENPPFFSFEKLEPKVLGQPKWGFWIVVSSSSRPRPTKCFPSDPPDVTSFPTDEQERHSARIITLSQTSQTSTSQKPSRVFLCACVPLQLHQSHPINTSSVCRLCDQLLR